MNGLRERAAKSLFWTILESGSLSGFSFITLVVFSRLLTPEDFGLAAMALSIVQILNIPVELFFHDALIQSKNASRIHFDTAYTVSAAFGVTLCAMCWAGADLVAGVVGEPALAAILRWMSLSLVAMGFGSTIIAHQRRIMAFRSLALRSVVSRTVAAAIGIALALLGAGIWSMVAQQVLTVTLATVVLWFTAKEAPRFRFSVSVLRELGGFGAKSVLVVLAGILPQRIFLLLVGRFLGSDPAGYFSLALRCINTLRSVLSSAVLQLAFPIFARRQDDRAGLARAFNSSIEFTCAITFPIFAIPLVIPNDVTRILFGQKWLPAAPLISILCALTLPFLVRQFATPALLAVGRPFYPVLGHLVSAALAAIGMAIAGYRSINAAAWVLIVVSLGPWPLEAWLVRHATGMGIWAQWRGVPRVAVATGCMMISMVLFHRWIPFDISSMGKASYTAVVGGIAYAAALVALNRSLVVRLIEFANSVWRSD